jgi:CO/xanthine dehydrogenase FAD-binding subunit
LVDLQDIGLDGIDLDHDQVRIGAMVRLQAIVEHEALPELLREMANREGPNTFRNVGTIGGVVVGADWESELLASLLVFGTQVTVQTQAEVREMELAQFLTDVEGALDGGLLTMVTLEMGGVTAHARVVRTPKDRPIVAALGRVDRQGQLRLALCGIADTPVLVDPNGLNTLTPLGDFRGSPEYRRQMAVVLGQRVVRALETV